MRPGIKVNVDRVVICEATTSRCCGEDTPPGLSPDKMIPSPRSLNLQQAVLYWILNSPRVYVLTLEPGYHVIVR